MAIKVKVHAAWLLTVTLLFLLGLPSSSLAVDLANSGAQSPRVIQEDNTVGNWWNQTLQAIRFYMVSTLAGEDVANDVMKVEQRFTYTNITLAAPTTTAIKSGPGFLHLITVNKTTALGVITCYDNTAASGTLIATITQPAAVLASQLSLPYDVAFSVGLTCVTATAAQDITVSYR